MKVSNEINVTRIYQEQLKKAQSKTANGDFSKVLDSTTKDPKVEAGNLDAISALKQNTKVDIAINNGKAESVDPVEVFKRAAEVFTSVPESPTREEKVSRIKALFDAGQYNIPAEAVAEKLWACGAVTVSWEG